MAAESNQLEYTDLPKGKRLQYTDLPKGSEIETVVRKDGLSAERNGIYHYSPNWRKKCSKLRLADCMGDVLDLVSFDYHTGKLKNVRCHKKMKRRGPQSYYSREARNNASPEPLLRQMASTFKKPVRVYKTQKTKVKTDFKHGILNKPKNQLAVLQGLSVGQQQIQAETPEISPIIDLTLNTSPVHKTNGITGITVCDKEFSMPSVFNQHMTTHEIAPNFPFNREARNNASPEPLLRQMASTFNQPGTAYKTQENKVKTDLKHEILDKPKNQLAVLQGLSVGQQQIQAETPEISPIIDLTLNTSPVHKTNGITGFTCQVCDKEFSMPSVFNQHMTTHEIAPNFPFNREACNNASPEPLLRQMASTFNQPGTAYKTQENKVKTDLKHVILDKPKNQFAVPQGRNVGQQQIQAETPEISPIMVDLTLNTSPVHKTNGITGFTCQVCDKVFLTQDVFNQHMVTHEIAPNFPFKCIICFSGYLTKQELQQHRLIYHTKTSREMLIPIVDVKRGVVNKLKRLGINRFLPLSLLTRQNE